MLYGIFRILFFGIFFIVVFFLLRRSKIVGKKLMFVITFLFTIILCSLSFLFPIENLFIRFKTPQEVFSYSSFGKVEDIVYGENSCMVIYSTGKHSRTYSTMPKSEHGYKIPSIFSIKLVSDKSNNQGSFKVNNVSGTSDYYLFGIIVLEDEADIVDSNHKELKRIIEKNENTDVNTIFFYLYVENCIFYRYSSTCKYFRDNM